MTVVLHNKSIVVGCFPEYLWVNIVPKKKKIVNIKRKVTSAKSKDTGAKVFKVPLQSNMKFFF